MKGILTEDGKHSDASLGEVETALAGGAFFWLDLDLADPGPDDDVTALLTDTFHFHPVAVQATEKFGQRARIDDYEDFVHVITFGAGEKGTETVEVHCFVTEKFIISLHHGDCPSLLNVRERIKTHHASDVASPPVVVLYLIMDALVDSFFPVLSEFDETIDSLEDAILANPTEDQLGTLFGMKRQLMTIKKVITPQRDMIAGLNSGVVVLPGATDQATEGDQGGVYFRNLYDHLIRISDQVDGYRDLLSGVMDTHLAMVSNRLNVVMKQLAIIATIFLPLGFLTGFFGQNFNYLVNHLLVSTWTFFVFGLGLEVIAIAGLMVLFKRRGWLGGPTA